MSAKYPDPKFFRMKDRINWKAQAENMKEIGGIEFPDVLSKIKTTMDESETTKSESNDSAMPLASIQTGKADMSLGQSEEPGEFSESNPEI